MLNFIFRMPSPQKAISTKNVVDVESSESDDEVQGLLERDFDGVNHMEASLLSELFDHFTGFGGILQAVEERGGEALASSLAQNEKFVTKISKFQARRDGQEHGSEGDGYDSV